MTVNKGGRPTVMTEEIVGKLEYGFMKGLNVTECCHYADISRSAFYDYVALHPEFSDRMDELRSNPSTKAKLNVVEAIENDTNPVLSAEHARHVLEIMCAIPVALKERRAVELKTTF